jgi:hypothetical protein
MPRTCKAKIVLANGTILIQGSKEFVAEQLARFAVPAATPTTSKNQIKNLVHVENVATARSAALSEREMISEKQPKGHHEVVAVLAFCLSQAGQEEFGEEEIRRAYIRAGVRPPKVVAQALRDAKNAHDFLESAGRGRYRLSPHGDRTVRFDLPRREGDQ